MKAKFDCRFCGCNNIQVLGADTTPWVEGMKPGYQVECINCGAMGPSGWKYQRDAIKAWETGDPTKALTNVTELTVVKKED